MKKIISSLIAISMTISTTCATAFAIDNTAVPMQNDFVYTDKVLQLYGDNGGIAPMSLDEYEPNDFDNPYSLGMIKAKGRPFCEVNASINDTNDLLDGYSVNTYEGGSYEWIEAVEEVEELVVLVGDLSYGDRLIVIITDYNDEEIASGVIDGDEGSTACVVFPTDGGNSGYNHYNIYIALASIFDGSTGYNSEVNYKLQVASRYVRGTQQFYANTTTIKYSGLEDWSDYGYMYINESNVPSSAIVDSIYVTGTLINTKKHIQANVSFLNLKNGTKEVTGTLFPTTISNVGKFEMPLAGTWRIKYRPHLNTDNNHELYNFSAKFDFTYDILVG